MKPASPATAKARGAKRKPGMVNENGQPTEWATRFPLRLLSHRYRSLITLLRDLGFRFANPRLYAVATLRGSDPYAFISL